MRECPQTELVCGGVVCLQIGHFAKECLNKLHISSEKPSKSRDYHWLGNKLSFHTHSMLCWKFVLLREENMLTFLISMIYLYTQHVMKNSICKGGLPVEQREGRGGDRERTSFRAYSCRFTEILPDSLVLKQPGSWEKQRCLLPNCCGCSPSRLLQTPGNLWRLLCLFLAFLPHFKLCILMITPCTTFSVELPTAHTRTSVEGRAEP